MSIFILEDDMIQGQQLKKIVEEICEEKWIPFDFVEVTKSSKQIIDKIPLTTYIPIYFLDIEIKNEERKGFEVAQEIRKYDPNGIIVFVTTHSELAPISYKYMVSALTFIDKNSSFEERYHLIEQCLFHYKERNEQEKVTDDFVVDNARATVRVPFKQLEYMMTDEPHRLTLVAKDRLVSFYGTLKEIESMDERLFRCHQSYVVNILQISYYDAVEKMIVLKSGKQIPVSRRHVSKVRQLLKGER